MLKISDTMNSMLKVINSVMLCVLLFACSDETVVNIPETVLPKQKMAEVLMDVHLLESSMNLNVYNMDRIAAENTTPGFDILKKNNVTKQQYDQSFDFYSKHPALLNEIYDSVLNNLSKMQAEVMNKK